MGACAASVILAANWSPAFAADIAASVSIQNDYQFRGYALALDRPVAIASLAIDHPSGYYGNVSAIGVLERDEGPEVLGAVANLGYARRLPSGVTLDAGLIGTQYFDVYGEGQSAAYGEAYIGVLTRRVSARVYASPEYFDSGSPTVYGELEGAIEPAPKLRLRAHVGVLAFLGDRSDGGNASAQVDWAIGASRRIGPFELQATLNGGGPTPEYYDRHPDDRAAIIVGASLSF